MLSEAREGGVFLGPKKGAEDVKDMCRGRFWV